MNINLDDPKLTAYALDELSGAEKAEMETAVAASPEAQEFVRELRLLTGNLRAAYDAERELYSIAHTNIVPQEQVDEPWSTSRRLALAAGIALCACLGALAIGTVKRGGLGNPAGRQLAGGPSVATTETMQSPVKAIDQSMPLPEEEPPLPPPADAREPAK